MTIVMGKPNFPPYVCIGCGMQDGRKWFVDLQLNLDHYFNPVLNGAAYLCNECFESMIRDTMRQVQSFLGVDTFPVGNTPTYENKSELLTEIEIHVDGSNGDDGSTVAEPILEVHDPVSAGIDFGSAEVVGASVGNQQESSSNSTGDAEPVSAFRAHFGGKRGN